MNEVVVHRSSAGISEESRDFLYRRGRTIGENATDMFSRILEDSVSGKPVITEFGGPPPRPVTMQFLIPKPAHDALATQARAAAISISLYAYRVLESYMAANPLTEEEKAYPPERKRNRNQGSDISADLVSTAKLADENTRLAGENAALKEEGARLQARIMSLEETIATLARLLEQERVRA